MKIYRRLRKSWVGRIERSLIRLHMENHGTAASERIMRKYISRSRNFIIYQRVWVATMGQVAGRKPLQPSYGRSRVVVIYIDFLPCGSKGIMAATIAYIYGQLHVDRSGSVKLTIAI